MENFEYKRHTNLIFGQNTLAKLGTEIKKYTNKKILFTYGGGSIKSIGLYDKVVEQLNSNNIEFIELGGIKPNPEIDTCRAGAQIIKDNDIDFILAVGGGSVLDNSKHMAIASRYDGDVWDLVMDGKLASSQTNLPKLGTIITVAATGSEMNNGGVITNPELNIKTGMFHEECTPVFTFEDPSILYTLPEMHRRAGVCDTLSHLLEVYFGEHKDDLLMDRIVESIISNVIETYPGYIIGEDYESCANIFLSSTLALNGITRLGRGKQDWMSHSLEHEVSAYTDLTHGIGLAIIQPQVNRYYYEQDVKANSSLIKYVNLGKNVFKLEGSDEEIAKNSIRELEKLFFAVSNVRTLSDVGITEFDAQQSVNKLLNGQEGIGQYNNLTEADLMEIFNRIK